MPRLEFTGTLNESDGGGGRWIEVPFDVKAAFGQARPPVRGTVNGTPLRSRLSVYGGRSYLGLRSEIRAAAGIEVGDRVDVVLELDDAPREVEVPPALAAALEHDANAREAFEALERRVAKAMAMLRDGIKHP